MDMDMHVEMCFQMHESINPHPTERKNQREENQNKEKPRIQEKITQLLDFWSVHICMPYLLVY